MYTPGKFSRLEPENRLKLVPGTSSEPNLHVFGFNDVNVQGSMMDLLRVGCFEEVGLAVGST